MYPNSPHLVSEAAIVDVIAVHNSKPTAHYKLRMQNHADLLDCLRPTHHQKSAWAIVVKYFDALSLSNLGLPHHPLLSLRVSEC